MLSYRLVRLLPRPAFDENGQGQAACLRAEPLHRDTVCQTSLSIIAEGHGLMLFSRAMSQSLLMLLLELLLFCAYERGSGNN